MAVLLWLLAPADPARRAVGGDRWAVFREVGTVIRLVGPLVSISILAQVIHAALLAFTALYLVDARGIPAPLAAVFFGVPQLAGMLGAPVGGFLSDRFGRRAVLVLGVGLLGPGFLALSLVPNELLVLPLLVTGIAGSMRITATEVFVTESAPAHRRATVLGGYYMLSQELGGLAAPILGLLAAAVGTGLAFGSASALLAVASVVALVLYRRS